MISSSKKPLILCLTGIFLLILTTFSLAVSPKRAFADDTTDVKRIRYINVVYDDSGSMVDESKAWCQAHYATELFAAMLDSNDELRIFTMSSADANRTEPDLVIKGSESIQERIKKAHSDFSQVNGLTHFGAARNAYSNLKSLPDNGEKWLIVLTDGEFNSDYGPDGGKSAQEINKNATVVLKEWSGEGINVEYVGLGRKIEAAEGESFHVQNIESGSILSGVVKESNRVFGRGELPSGSYHEGQLNINVPMDKIVVLAQGPNVTIGSLEIDGVTYAPTEMESVKYADKPHATISSYYDGADLSPDTNLQGVVATFESSEGYSTGAAALKIANAEAVNVYYRPYVKVELTLTNTATGEQIVIGSADQQSISPGTYRSEYRLLNPFSGSEVLSDLITSTEFKTQLTTGEETTTVPDGGEVVIPEGRASLTGVAIINNEVIVPQEYNLSILSKELGVEKMSGPEQAIEKYSMEQADPIVVKVTKMGKELTSEEWAHTKLYVGSPDSKQATGLFGWLFETEKSLGAVCTPGSVPGTYEVKLRPHMDSPANTLDGEVPLVFQAIYDPGYGQSYGQLQTTQQINSNFLLDFLNWLRLHFVQLILLIFCGLLVAFVLLELKKPRLPKLKPYVEGIEGAPDEIVKLRYSHQTRAHRIWPPWAPETGVVMVSPKGGPAHWHFPKRFHLAGQKIAVVATQSKGKKAVRIDEETLAMMKRHEARGELPAPEYAGECAAFTAGRKFSFQGVAPHPKKGFDKPAEQTYHIGFF